MSEELSLKSAWALRAMLHAEGAMLHAGGDKVYAQGAQLYAQGAKVWAEAILKIKGNIIIEWQWNSKRNDYDCKLETGEVFKV